MGVCQELAIAEYVNLAEKDITYILNKKKTELVKKCSSNSDRLENVTKLLREKTIVNGQVKEQLKNIYVLAYDINNGKNCNELIYEPLSYVLYIALIKEGDNDIRNDAINMLTRYGRYDYLKEFSGPIKKAIKNVQPFPYDLYVKCKLDSTEKNKINIFDTNSIIIKALLGDTLAENHILNVDICSKKNNEKRDYLNSLYVLNTDKSVKKIVEMLNDNSLDTLIKEGQMWHGNSHQSVLYESMY